MFIKIWYSLFLTGKTSKANGIIMAEDPRKWRESGGRKKIDNSVEGEYEIHAEIVVEADIFENHHSRFEYKT